MDAQTIGGYPVNITTLVSGQIIFFNGQEWVAEFITNPAPTIYPLTNPTILNENPFSLNGVPVVIYNLQPGDVLTLAMYTGLVPVDSLALTIPYYQVLKNAPWSSLYANMDSYLNLTRTEDVNTEGTIELVLSKSSLDYSISVI